MALSMMSANNALAQEMTWSPTATRFALWSPAADSVKVNIYAEGIGGKPLKTVMLGNDNVTGQWAVKVLGDMKGKFYTFQIKQNGKWMPETPGISAKAVGVNGQRGAVIDMRDTNPAGWENDRAPLSNGPQDAILYEMHHRDFSVDPSSGIKNKGKFIALTEQGTTNPDGLATGIDHLKELGVTHVHLLPSYDYGSIDETTGNALGGGGRVASTYNWGYDPVNYNAPEGSYSTNAYDPAARIREFKQMVMALHKAGIRVVMDVVYNHVFDLEQSPFHRTAPGYFFRYKADGTPANGSGCGNETASDKEMYRQFMVESIEHWMKEYHVDGFRFDLMAIHDVETMNLIRQKAQSIDPNVIIYGEGWAAEAPAIPEAERASKENTALLGGIAAFGDEMRDGLRGGWTSDKDGAFLIGNAGNEESVKFGIVGAIDHPQVDMTKVNYSKQAWASSPSQMISYVSCHDDMCLADRLKTTLAEQKKVEGDKVPVAERVRLQKLAETAVLTSQGIPFIWCGDEVMRDKKGVHNSFSSPDDINQIPWTLKSEHKDVFEYIAALVQMRKAHPAFHMGCACKVKKNLEFLPVKASNVIAYTLNGKAVGDEWDTIVVILNSNRKAVTQQVPQGKYTVVCSDGKVNLDGMAGVNGRKVVVPAQSAVIMWTR